VQSVTLQENSLGRRFGIASLAIDVAGGQATGQRVPSLAREQASLLRSELLSAQP
jgi:membrane protein YdbS with pleckstrin-like domain